jgi:hypothetical protein
MDGAGALDGEVTALIWRERSPELRAWCLARWAEGPGYAALAREGVEYPGAAAEVLESLSRAGRVVRLAALAPFLDYASIEAVLRVAARPFDVDDRRVLVAHTHLLPAGERREGPYRSVHRSRRAPLQPVQPALDLWGCLAEAYTGPGAPGLTKEEEAWAVLLEARIEGADDEPWEQEAMERLLRLLRPATPRPTRG